jgi:acyl-CoA reductase-like NAD-dependent aldehyde dehydrogenase
VLKFKTFDEAIERANNSTYGLAASIFTADINKAFKYANLVDAGTVWINTHNAFDTAQPFGGFKQSGFGRELGEYALQLYTEVKTVMIALSDTPVKN